HDVHHADAADDEGHHRHDDHHHEDQAYDVVKGRDERFGGADFEVVILAQSDVSPPSKHLLDSLNARGHLALAHANDDEVVVHRGLHVMKRVIGYEDVVVFLVL